MDEGALLAKTKGAQARKEELGMSVMKCHASGEPPIPIGQQPTDTADASASATLFSVALLHPLCTLRSGRVATATPRCAAAAAASGEVTLDGFARRPCGCGAGLTRRRMGAHGSCRCAAPDAVGARGWPRVHASELDSSAGRWRDCFLTYTYFVVTSIDDRSCRSMESTCIFRNVGLACLGCTDRLYKRHILLTHVGAWWPRRRSLEEIHPQSEKTRNGCTLRTTNAARMAACIVATPSTDADEAVRRGNVVVEETLTW